MALLEDVHRKWSHAEGCLLRVVDRTEQERGDVHKDHYISCKEAMGKKANERKCGENISERRIKVRSGLYSLKTCSS